MGSLHCMIQWSDKTADLSNAIGPGLLASLQTHGQCSQCFENMCVYIYRRLPLNNHRSGRGGVLMFHYPRTNLSETFDTTKNSSIWLWYHRGFNQSLPFLICKRAGVHIHFPNCLFLIKWDLHKYPCSRHNPKSRRVRFTHSPSILFFSLRKLPCKTSPSDHLRGFCTSEVLGK